MNQVTSTGSDIDRDEPGTIWTQLRRVAAADGDKVAYVTVDDDGVRADVSYSAMVDAAEALAAGLLELGVRRGERVGVWMTNRVDWLRTYFAVMRLGAVLVPLNTWLKPNEVEFVLRHAGVRHLVTLDRFRQLDFVGALDPVHPELAELDTVIVARRTAGAGPAHRFLDLHDVGSSPVGRRLDGVDHDAAPDDLAFVKYTSGSTGFPKGVMWTHDGILRNARRHTARLRLGRDDRFFSSMPFFHGGGSVWGIATMLSRGGTLVFTEAFDPPLAARLLESERCTVFFGVLGNEVLAAARTDRRDLSSVRMSMTGGADAAELMPNSRPIIRPFGLTETYGPGSLADLDDPPDKQLATHGRPLDGNEIRAVDPDTGRDVPTGTVGEAWVRGNIMRGYWNDPAATAATIDADGWLHSGDLVSVDAEGYVTFVGRLKLMLKVGGENVSVEEVERQILEHPGVHDCVVVGVPDERKLEVARAYVVFKPSATTSGEELMTWLRGRMARFKVPREIITIDEVPHLANGKRDRQLMQDRARSEPAPVGAR